MKRVIIKAPENTTLTALTVEQQTAIRSIFSQWVMPMPGTKANTGYTLIDAVVGDNFDPARISALGLPFTVMGMWQWGGASSPVELQALDATFINYLPATHTYNPITNAVLTTSPPVLHEPHRWAGWPEINL